jgi:hypothetical protein
MFVVFHLSLLFPKIYNGQKLDPTPLKVFYLWGHKFPEEATSFILLVKVNFGKGPYR